MSGRTRLIIKFKQGKKMTIFLGTFDELKNKVEQTGLNGEWKCLGNGQKQFKTKNGAFLNWWENKGTINFQGPSQIKADFESKLLPLLNTESMAKIESNSLDINRKIFVVYGHDENARSQLDAMLRRWGLEPLILDQLPSKGQTIIEKLEDYTNDIGFGVVLATPDDEGHRKDRADEKTYRARQNVVLELGMLLTKLGRQKVAILLRDQEKMERPSDIQGLIYIPFKENLQKEAGPLLAKEMAAQGYNIDIINL